MIDAIGARQFTRWMALAELDGWGEEHRDLVVLLAAMTGTPVAKLLPDYSKPKPKEPITNETRMSLNRLAGF